MSDAQLESYSEGRFIINDDLVLRMVEMAGEAGACNDELWNRWREGQELTEKEIHGYHNQIIGRTSDLLKEGLLISTKEPYTMDNGNPSTRSRYFKPAVKQPRRMSKNEQLQARIEELETKLKATGDLQYKIDCRDKLLQAQEIEILQLKISNVKLMKELEGSDQLKIA